MSIYNGFATRHQEASYNKAMFNMMFLLQHSLMRAFNGQSNEEQFGKHFSKLYK